jgi:hypothetical protein
LISLFLRPETRHCSTTVRPLCLFALVFFPTILQLQADESLALLELIVQRAPTDTKLQLQLATALLAASKQARADGLLQALLDKHPTDGKH